MEESVFLIQELWFVIFIWYWIFLCYYNASVACGGNRRKQTFSIR